MTKSQGALLRLAVPLRAWVQRSALLLLITVAVVLMLLGRTQTGVVQTARTVASDAVAPVLDFLSRPVSGTVDLLERMQSLVDLAGENAELREANRRLRNWQVVAYRLEAENAALRDLLRLAPDPRTRYVTARVVADNGGAFVRSVLVNAGGQQGVALGQAAVTGEGLAGRVAQVGSRSARVLLITDINSRIPVMLAHSRARAMLAGTNSNHPMLLYLDPRTQVKPGDRVLTSGDGGVFPAGLPIGVVIAGEEDEIRVQSYVDWNRMEYLRLIDYELPGMLLPAARED